jgi:hypothetical protein
MINGKPERVFQSLKYDVPSVVGPESMPAHCCG